MQLSTSTRGLDDDRMVREDCKETSEHQLFDPSPVYMTKDEEIHVASAVSRCKARNMDVLIAWPPSGSLPGSVREEKFSADE
jgi:hypothetical protein